MEKFVEKHKKSLMAGFYTFLILLLIEKIGRPTYGYEISKWVTELSNGKFKLAVGTMYPILKNLESKKIIKSFWGESKEGPPRKYYILTQEGEKALEEMKEFWVSLKELVEKLMGR